MLHKASSTLDLPYKHDLMIPHTQKIRRAIGKKLEVLKNTGAGKTKKVISNGTNYYFTILNLG